MGAFGYMTWSPDSKYVGFDTSFTSDAAFFRVNIPGGQISRIVSLKDVRRFFPMIFQRAPDGTLDFGRVCGLAVFVIRPWSGRF